MASSRVLILLIAVVVGAVSCGRGSSRRNTLERAYVANNRGVAALEQFDYADAAAAFREALRIDGALAIAHVNLSLALLYSQDQPAAAREADAAARLLPSAPQPHYLLGLIARAENRNADALRDFERVRQLDPADVGAAINLGQIYLEQQQYEAAIPLLRAATAAEPYNVTAAYNLGLALTRSGHTDEGSRVLQGAQTLRATGYAVTYGTGYLEQGRYAEALTSNGTEPELVDVAVPRVTFTGRTIGSSGFGERAASPFGRPFSAADLSPNGMQQIASGLAGCVALIDYDGDGQLDLFDAATAGQQLLHNEAGNWADATAASGLVVTAGAVPIGCLVGDYDNDGKPDLFVLRYGRSSLYRNDGRGRFNDVTASAGIAEYRYLPGAAAFVDVDHDGDLDLVVAGLADLNESRARAATGALVFPSGFAPAPLQLLRNNGNGTFTDTTVEARLTTTGHAIAIVPADFDNRRDVDLLIVNRIGPPQLFKNLRDGTFRDVAGEVGLTAIVRPDDEITAVTAADVNKDDFPDFFFARASGGVFAMSDGRERFMERAAPAGAHASLAAQFADYDNDGLLDLITWSDAGAQLFRNLGNRWSEVTDATLPSQYRAGRPSSARALALADLDRDGRTDVVLADGGSLTVYRNTAVAASRSVRIALKGLSSNRLGIGSKVQVRAGSLRSRLETSAATPPAAPADLVFGLGRRSGADAIRIVWPSGILQAEVEPSPSPSAVVIEELNRKPSSCPFLFTWNGERFEFVTDFMGGGEMGYWEGPGKRNTPNPVEYVRIAGDQLKPKAGKYELRITDELEETLFADRFQLVAITHPAEMGVYPNEGMSDAPKPFRLFAVTNERVPRAADDAGRDVTEQVARLDRHYVDGFALDRFRGYAARHALTLDLDPVGDAPVLLLTGWTDYAFSSDNLAAHQAGRSLTAPSLEVREPNGRWRTIVEDIGIPVGRPQTVAVDLAGRLRPGEHEVRVVTNMRIYWDLVRVGRAVGTDRVNVQRLDAVTATLRRRGFSANAAADGLEPSRYDYQRVSAFSPWKIMPGRYTREGDVRALLAEADDMFVVAKPGDEIALAFDADAAGYVRAGWTRTFLLLADGFSKEMDINSASPDVAAPMPFHGMRAYPYEPPQRYPDTLEHQHYQATYNTRVVTRTMPRY